MDVQAVLAAQTEMYGEPLGDRMGRLLGAYQVSQARLAAVLGLSPPMLSQLMSAQRAKISNPTVLGRLVRLEELVPTVTDPATRDAALEEVRRSRPTLHTGQLVGTPAADPYAGARVLAGLAAPDVLRRASGEVSDPGLAALLRAAADLPR
jgi:hypothetical protein